MPFALTPLARKLLGSLLILAVVAGLFIRGNHYRAQRDDERDHVAKWQAANEAATQWAKAEKAAKDAAARDIKEAANDTLKPTLAAGDDAARRYAQSNRCVRVASEGDRVGADMSGPASPAGQPETAGGAPAVAVSERDLGICTAAVLRLENALTWAQDAISKGLAE